MQSWGHISFQSAPDSSPKLQKLEIELDTLISPLVEFAYWVFNNQEKSEDEKTRRQALQCQPVSRGIWTNRPRRFLTPVSDPCPPLRDSKPRKLGHNQHAICKQEGHWKGKCPCWPRRGTDMAYPSHYPQRQMVQIDEEWQGQGASKLALQLTPEEPWLTLGIRGSLSLSHS